MTKILPRFLLTASALFLLVIGAALNFMAPEVAGLLGMNGVPQAALILQLLAGFLLGAGVINWMLKRNPIGGIYGRPLCVANLLQFTVATFALGRAAWHGQLPVAGWVLCAICAVFALGFGWLIFARPSSGRLAAEG